MTRPWTFGQKIGAGFVVMVAVTVAVGLVAVLSLRHVVSSADRVVDVNARLLIDAQRLRAAGAEKSSEARGFLLTRDQHALERMTKARAEFVGVLAELKRLSSDSEGQRQAAAIERSEAEHQRALDGVLSLRRAGARVEVVGRAFERQVIPKRAALDSVIDAIVAGQERRLADGRRAARSATSSATTLVAVSLVASVTIAVLLAFVLGRTLRRRIGATVGQVNSSSTELQATANQQATGAREQATAMNEIATTIAELLASAKQIAESAQRVAVVAEQTANAGRSGEGTIATAQEAIGDIRRQMDAIVNHMLELGDKSQQIGAVLDIVSELAEQTNILSINATIEAAGAGEAGRRFATVADEIRKLAERVAGSAKEIRGLIDDVRGAVNTTVMATETGSKAVDAGFKQFADVAASFEEIAGLVATTTEVAREIELSTKQQSTAVEQTNTAIANVAQATKETEVSSSQTLQTASQLTTLSREMQRLVEPRVSA
jgi:methyl-accepting chemotaxis protein